MKNLRMSGDDKINRLSTEDIHNHKFSDYIIT